MWEHYSRKTLDASQRLAVEVMMAESRGRWAARTTGREEPRQNGKGEEFEVVELWGIVQRAEAILHTAHELTTVSSAHQRMVSLVQGHADLRRRTRKVLNGIGQQLIEMTNDGVIAYRTRTNGGGRGLDDISRLVIDEAQHAKPEQLASSTPILLANPNPQMNFAGTGAIEGVSDWWWELRKRALGKEPGAFGYVGHTAETVRLADDGSVIQEPVDPYDRKLWFDANPALLAGRGEIEFFEEQLRTLGPALFAREHLGVWDPEPRGAASGPITVHRWAELKEPGSTATNDSWKVAIEVSEDQMFTSISAAGLRSDGQVHVEVVRRQAGDAWVVPFAKTKAAELGVTFKVHENGPAGYLIPQLVAAGVPVEPVSGAALSASRLLSEVNAGTIHHCGGKELVDALGAATIVTNAQGVKTWSRVKSSGDISALVAATIAVGGVAEDRVFAGGFYDLNDFVEE